MAIWGDDKKTKEMTDAIVAGISATIADSVAKTMQPVFTELVGEIKNALGETRDQQNKAAADLAEAMRSMKSLMESVTSNLASMQKATAGQQEVLSKLAEVQKVQSETQKSLTQECETAFAGVRDTQNKLSALYNDIGSGATALVAREEGVVKNQKKVLDTMSEDMISLQTKWTENFNKANTNLTANYDKMFKEMESAIASLKEYSDSLNGFSDNIGKTMNEYNAGIAAGFDGFKNRMESTVSDTFAAIDKQLASAVETLGKTTEEINEAALRIPKAMRGLN